MFEENPTLFKMEWSVSKSGYEIIQTHYSSAIKGRKKAIAEIVKTDSILPVGNKWKKYNPFVDCPGMAREFAAIPFDLKKRTVNYKAIKKFAEKFGVLGLSDDKSKAEDLNAWFARVVLFWDIFQNIDMGLLDVAVTEFNNCGPDPSLKMIISQGKLKRERFLGIQPVTLYGAMWIMVANEISKGTQLQECIMTDCGVWFPIRSNKRFCGDKCKVAWHRLKKP